MTPLDEALQTARANSQQANFFYDAFLNSDLFVPVRLLGTANGSWRRLGPQDKFQPLFILSSSTESSGASQEESSKVVPVFDQLERLKAWAQDRSFDYVEIRCHLFLRVLAAEVGLVLNAGTDYSHGFSPEILERLRAAMQPVQPV